MIIISRLVPTHPAALPGCHPVLNHNGMRCIIVFCPGCIPSRGFLSHVWAPQQLNDSSFAAETPIRVPAALMPETLAAPTSIHRNSSLNWFPTAGTIILAGLPATSPALMSCTHGNVTQNWTTLAALRASLCWVSFLLLRALPTHLVISLRLGVITNFKQEVNFLTLNRSDIHEFWRFWLVVLEVAVWSLDLDNPLAAAKQMRLTSIDFLCQTVGATHCNKNCKASDYQH
mmetsp:Transcript_146835/g.258785  ORF Transcript_146835/g.258785 Transcript_146835/m.258785 type:complete len:230 (+) Transcript_146835:27-716(+)